jgi:hypothetical protein
MDVIKGQSEFSENERAHLRHCGFCNEWAAALAMAARLSGSGVDVKIPPLDSN